MPETNHKIRNTVRSFLTFSRREGRRILLLLPLLAILSLLFLHLETPTTDDSFALYTDKVLDNSFNKDYNNRSHINTRQNNCQRFTPFEFDPNTIDMSGLMRLGFSRRQAEVIIHYRNSGAVFHDAEDFAKCYTVSTEAYQILKPYIKIKKVQTDNKAGQNTHNNNRPLSNDTVTIPVNKDRGNHALTPFDPNTIDLGSLVAFGFTERQAQVIINYRNKGGRFRTPEDFARAYTVSPEMYEKLRPYIVIATETTKPESNLPVELNTADTSDLIAVNGIGPITARRIIEYRKRLGGFAQASQLQEIEGMTDRNYQMILKQIFVDSSVIQKIDINFADPRKLAGHPYLKPKTLAKLLKYRQLKGGWSNLRDLVNDKILTEEEATKLAPYLYFSPKKGNF